MPKKIGWKSVEHAVETLRKEGKRRCSVCGEEKTIDAFRVRRKMRHGKKGSFLYVYTPSRCRKCDGRFDPTSEWSMEDEVRMKIYSVSHDCTRKGIAFDLDTDWVLQRLSNIGFSCEISGIPFDFVRKEKGKKIPKWDTLSFDRINPYGGYTKDNVRLVLYQVNLLRGRYEDGIVLRICEGVVNHLGGKNRNAAIV